MRLRRWLYARGFFSSHQLPGFVISVGNLEAGGTGKSPIVMALAQALLQKGARPAILTRGYRAEATGGSSDEAQMLAELLGDRAAVIANPDRVIGAREATQQAKKPDVFLLDDAFQHRRVRRDFDLVLVNATEPFGFGHVLPRGLLRESMHGITRAHAVVVTRANTVTGDALQQVTTALRYWNNYIPIYVADHVHASLLTREGEQLPIETLREKKFFAFSGVASPASLKRQLDVHGPTFAGFRAFPDHHAYTAADLEQIATDATAAGAEMIVTTEKDWVKVAALPSPPNVPPIVRTELQIRFRHNYGEDLMGRIMQRLNLGLGQASSSAAATAAAMGGTDAGKGSETSLRPRLRPGR
jgi:tetraacyldisaccharide 4'-kinase